MCLCKKCNILSVCVFDTWTDKKHGPIIYTSLYYTHLSSKFTLQRRSELTGNHHCGCTIGINL